jgi:UDP-galactopyranose mutase
LTNKKVVILGAGLSGLSAAWHLQRKGVNPVVFEKEHDAGGLCRTKKVDNFIFDYDGHLLHFKQKYTFELVKELFNGNLAEHKRSAWVSFKNRYIAYPFQANLHGLPSEIAKECLMGFFKAQKNGKNKCFDKLSFLDWVYSTFGEGIAKYFMIPYNQKFWKTPLENLTCGWFDGFIPVPSLDQVIEGTIEESHREFGYNSKFWYPKTGGINQLPLAFAKGLNRLFLDSKVDRIDLRRKQIELSDGRIEEFDYVVSTIPLPELPHLIAGLPKRLLSAFSKLRWTSILNLNIGVDSCPDNEKHWIYFPQNEISFFRVGYYNNFSDFLAPRGLCSLYIEASFLKGIPENKDNIIKLIKADLKKTGLVSSNIVATDINEIEYGYPVYDNNYSKSQEEITRFLRKNNIIPCGRYGSWKYFSMEDAINDGKRASEEILRPNSK